MTAAQYLMIAVMVVAVAATFAGALATLFYTSNEDDES